MCDACKNETDEINAITDTLITTVNALIASGEYAQLYDKYNAEYVNRRIITRAMDIQRLAWDMVAEQFQ